MTVTVEGQAHCGRSQKCLTVLWQMACHDYSTYSTSMVLSKLPNNLTVYKTTFLFDYILTTGLVQAACQ